MEINDMVMVSVDDHVVEPPDLFDGRLPAKYADLAPKFITNEDGTNAWLYEGSVLPNVALNAVAGRPREEYGIEPTSFEQLRPGCYDIDERVKDMDANGVLGSLCFPSFPQFCGQLFARTEDKDVALAMVQAYNDWHIDEWCGTHPGRFIPCPLPAIWDPEVLAAEVRRTAAKGAHAVTFSENPSKLGWPSIHSDHWDPFWKACSDEAVVVCMHIGSSSEMVITSPDAPIDCLITLTPMNIVQAAADLVWSPVLRKFPDLKVALSEGGIGWIPYFLERIDYNYDRHHAWTGQDFGDQPPERGVQRARADLLHRRPVRCGQPRVPRHGQRDVGVRLPALRLDLADRARDADAGAWTGCPTTTSTGSPTSTPCATSTTTPSPCSGGKENCTVGALRATGGRPRRLHPVPEHGQHREAGDQVGRPDSAAALAATSPRSTGRPLDAAAHRTSTVRRGTTVMANALAGFRVLEVAAWTFVPAAGAVLADWGADVIKVEHPVER